MLSRGIESKCTNSKQTYLTYLFFAILIAQSVANIHMKKPTYTPEQIIEAGEKLQKDGKRVTPFGIRNIMGGGNPARIREIWDSHGTTVPQLPQLEQSVPLPAEFSDTLISAKNGLDQLAHRLYAKAQEISESRVRESIAASQLAQEQAEAEVVEAMKSVEQSDTENTRLFAEIEALQEQLSSLNSEKSRLEERLQIAQAKESDTREQLNALQKEHKESFANTVRYQERAEQAEKQNMSLQRIIDKMGSS